MNNHALILYIILAAGLPVTYFYGGFLLAALFFLIWFDEVVFSILKVPAIVGLEFATLASVVLGLNFGPVAAFVFLVVYKPITRTLRQLWVSYADENESPFAPSAEELVFFLISLLAMFFAFVPFLFLFMFLVIVKDVLVLLSDIYIDGELDPYTLNMVPNFFFNLFIGYYASGLLGFA